MGKMSLKDRLKQWVAGKAWRLFIWGNNTTDEEYWNEVYETEKSVRENK